MKNVLKFYLNKGRINVKQCIIANNQASQKSYKKEKNKTIFIVGFLFFQINESFCTSYSINKLQLIYIFFNF
jgi:hypothetical protein